MPDSKDDVENPVDYPIDSRRNYFDASVANSICEAIDIPKVLYRAISVSPEVINKDFFDAPLRTNAEGTSNTQGEKTIGDGNEFGTYMSDNITMVTRTSYAGNGISIKTLQFHDGRSVTNNIKLPSCGIVYEINTVGLEVRKPKITSQLAGVYNNGFAGNEWIMDEAPASSYKVNQLILRKHPNDEHALVRKIDQENYEQSLQEAITALQNKYLEKKENADSFLQYLSGLTDAQRSNGYLMSKQMKAYNL